MKVEISLFKNWIVYFDTPTTKCHSSVSIDSCIIFSEDDYRFKRLEAFERLEKEDIIDNKQQLVDVMKAIGKHHQSTIHNNIIKAKYIRLELDD